MGSFCLTEVGHGSNVRGIETTAHFDPKRQMFILNSPTPSSYKFWIGNLAKTCHNSVIWANLISADGKNNGPHAFVCKVRDEIDHLPLPGIDIGDCGEKIGLNYIDNGYLAFKNFRVPKTALLNKIGDVNEKGEYISNFESSGKRFGLHIASLTGGRVNIARLTTDQALLALKIALRYGLVRKQFGSPEKSLLDYPMHQFRLFTRLAENLNYWIASRRVTEIW